MSSASSRIEYSEKYADDVNEYRCDDLLWDLVWVDLCMKMPNNARIRFAIIDIRIDATYLCRQFDKSYTTFDNRSLTVYQISFTYLFHLTINVGKACDSSERTSKATSENAAFNRRRMAGYWSSTKSWMAALCNSSVSNNEWSPSSEAI